MTFLSPITSADYFRTLLAVSTAFMAREHNWHRDGLPANAYEEINGAAMSELLKPFDFIIVGSGYSGSLLAKHLATGGCFRILVVETGSMPSFDTAIPFLRPDRLKDITETHVTISQRNAAKGLTDQKVKLLVSKAFGGQSAIESGVFMPANPSDFIRMSHGHNMSNWELQKLQPFLVEPILMPRQERQVQLKNFTKTFCNATSGRQNASRSQNCTNLSRLQRPDLDSSGDNRTSKNRSRVLELSNQTSLDQDGLSAITDAWAKSWKALGYNELSKPYESYVYQDSGYFSPPTLLSDGTILNVASHFLRDSAVTDNVMLLLNVNPTKIIFDSGSPKPLFLEFQDRNGKDHMVHARREMILTAGAIPTAELLIKSGVGPQDHLREINIPVVRNLPVGAAFWDRVSIQLYMTIHKYYLDKLKDTFANVDNFMEYMEEGEGVYTNPRSFGSFLFKSNPRLTEADLLIELKPLAIIAPASASDVLHYANETTKHLNSFGEPLTNGGLEIRLTLLRPFSQGVFWLKKESNHSSRLEDVSNPSYLQDFRDTQALVRGITTVEQLLATDYFRQLEANLVRPVFKGCPRYADGPRRYWLCVVRQLATSGHMPGGTAPFGSVVDEDFRVQSLEGLRVVDESLFPQPFSGGVAATLMTMANRAAESIKRSYHSILLPECRPEAQQGPIIAKV